VDKMVDDVFSPYLFFSFPCREHGYLSLLFFLKSFELMSICAQAFFSFSFSLFLDSHVLYGSRRYVYIFSKGETRLYSGLTEHTSSV